MKLPSTFMPNKAFTLIEVLITLALLSTVAVLGLFATTDMYRATSVRDERDTVVSLLTRARSHAMNNLLGLPHGFCYDETQQTYVSFKDVYASNNIEDTASKGKSITVSGLPLCGSGDEIIFTQLSGTTTPASFSLSESQESYTTTVNDEGTILW